jgi:ankyrin repeat protein
MNMREWGAAARAYGWVVGVMAVLAGMAWNVGRAADDPVRVLGAGGALRAAAEAGDVEGMTAALGRGAGVDDADVSDMTPLMLAARQGHLVAVRLLLDRGASVAANGVAEPTALGLAAMYGHRDVVRELLARGADPNARSRHGDGVLWKTCITNADPSDVLADLLAAGADPNGRTRHGWTPLMAAAQVGSERAVRMLLAAGADARAVDDQGMTAMDWVGEGTEPVAAAGIRRWLREAVEIGGGGGIGDDGGVGPRAGDGKR